MGMFNVMEAKRALIELLSAMEENRTEGVLVTVSGETVRSTNFVDVHSPVVVSAVREAKAVLGIKIKK